MDRKLLAIGGFGSAIAAAAVIAGCGGGGSSLGPIPGPNPSPSPSIAPSPSPTPVLNGTANVATSGAFPVQVEGPAANASVIFSCGCSIQAGTTIAGASGTFQLVTVSTPTPPSPNPTYTIVPGRNYLEVATTAGGAESWDIAFAGHATPNNLYLTGASDSSNPYTAAVALFVYFHSTSSAVAFDDWNFNTLLAWYTQLSTTPAASLPAAEKKLLQDIVSRQVINKTLYPQKPTWNQAIVPSGVVNNDLTAITSAVDPNIPTPCPTTGCTGTPTP